MVGAPTVVVDGAGVVDCAATDTESTSTSKEAGSLAIGCMFKE